jgi:nucleotide-binding universal stress UspA family protein
MKTELKAVVSSDVNPFRPATGRNLGQNSNGTDRCLASLKIHEILVPIDFSDHSNVALQHAVLVANQFRAAITLLHVVERPLVNPELMCPDPISPDQITLQAERCLSQTCEHGKLQLPRRRRTLIKRGVPYEQIVETASSQPTDLIVIATHDRGGLAQALLRSTAEKVIRHAPCPVLVIRLNPHA